jgi:hypothetical protein
LFLRHQRRSVALPGGARYSDPCHIIHVNGMAQCLRRKTHHG